MDCAPLSPPSGPSPGAFGRGWIPAGRDIGLPDDRDALQSCNPARPRHDGFTPERRVRFLPALATQGSVRLACAATGVSPQAAYLRKRRDPAFAQGWEGALVLARDHAEQVLADRAIHGVTETIFYRGEAVGQRTRFDARLLLAHLARLDRHCLEAERGQAAAARFDEFLDALLRGETDAGWDQESDGWLSDEPTRAEWIAEHVGAAEQAFMEAEEAEEEEGEEGEEGEAGHFDHDPDPEDPEEGPEEDPDDIRDRAFRAEQARARAEAALAWDHAQEERCARIDALAPDGGEGPDAGGDGIACAGGACSAHPAATNADCGDAGLAPLSQAGGGFPYSPLPLAGGGGGGQRPCVYRQCGRDPLGDDAFSTVSTSSTSPAVRPARDDASHESAISDEIPAPAHPFTPDSPRLPVVAPCDNPPGCPHRADQLFSGT